MRPHMGLHIPLAWNAKHIGKLSTLERGKGGKGKGNMKGREDLWIKGKGYKGYKGKRRGKGRGKDHFRGGPGRGFDQRPGERDRDRDNQYQRDRRDRDRDRDRNRDRRRRPASSTSSESRGDQEAKRLERHRRWMYEKDPTYKAYVDQVESDLRDAEVRRQGEIMARALQDSLDRAFKENKLMPMPSTGKASCPPPTPPGGKASAPADHPAGSNGTATPPRAPASQRHASLPQRSHPAPLHPPHPRSSPPRRRPPSCSQFRTAVSVVASSHVPLRVREAVCAWCARRDRGMPIACGSCRQTQTTADDLSVSALADGQ